MKTLKASQILTPLLAFACMLAFAPALAEKPSWAGGGKSDNGGHTDKNKGGGQKNEQHNAGGKSSRGNERREHFESRHHELVRGYYDEHYRDGRCPPGLAKKHNGCMPPGQAKKWHIGQPLPRDVIYYTVPQQLVLQIGPPPSGYLYVRVSSDILMMAIGTGMIVDAIQNLGRS